MICKSSYWIWNYGDYEIFHSNRINSRREHYGSDRPCFWRLYDVDRNVMFYREFTAENSGSLKLSVNGMGSITVDDDIYSDGREIAVSAGKHSLKICVTNLTGLPAAFLESDVCPTDGEWYTLDENMNKIPVGFEKCYNTAESNPECFNFKYDRVYPVNSVKRDGGTLFDFGKELFGYLYIEDVIENDRLHVSYGESAEEAVDVEYSVIREDCSGSDHYKLRQRAFRYIFITGAEAPVIYADLEYLPLEYKGSFECNSEAVNKIWDMCAYTLKLTAREVMLEAVKRDGWLWGGDAYQAYKFCNYLFFDKELIRRSTIALRGKEPFCEHINTITDYSFYWVIGLREYYQNFKDTEFLKFIYPRAVSLMEFSSKRTNGDGFIVGKGNDWIFIDWSDIDKFGALAAEQMLFIAANRAMAEISEILGYNGSDYAKTADTLTERVNSFFWSEEKGAFIDSYESGKCHVTRHANIFAVMYGIATESQREAIVKNVLLNDEITQITTPYFEGYELDVFGMLGNFDYIENKINTYWKGMLDLGATTVWEEYNPENTGIEHYKMYGAKYEKSLCHAWGAAPIYLLGKYFLGVAPTSDGFDTFTVTPHLGGFEYIKGTVPIKDGEVRVYLSKNELSVTATRDGGTLIHNGKSYTLKADNELMLNF